ncbi:MAG: enoyl-CoA hydratase-related protein [Rhodospirillales bacterium]|nr:enoyl-CoA hydratase-related protein [Rhodospirillales bacterium]MDE0713205.1 enoyl-CoA hydratase-related protein [Rhodospirillales bacterium]
MDQPTPSDAPPVAECTLEIRDRAAMLAFDRHDVRNALTGTKILEDLLAVTAWINRSRAVSVLVLTGNGSAFSAGGNVKDMRNRSGDFEGPVQDIEHAYRHGIQRMPRAISDLDVPVIAAVNGPAIGAGCDLACMCDIRIGGESARFAESFVNLGIIPGDGGAWFLPRVVGMQRAAEMTYTGRTVGADEALAIGLLLEVVPDDELRHRALELAATIAAKPPVTLRYAKRLMRMAQSMPLDQFLDTCAVYQGVAHQTDDHHEALAAFFEKRSGVYHGR